MTDSTIEYIQRNMDTAPFRFEKTARLEFIISERIFVNDKPQYSRIARITTLHSGHTLCANYIKSTLDKCAGFDDAGRPLNLSNAIHNSGYVKIPLDDESGGRIALLMKLILPITTPARQLLLANRLSRFTREEILYWLTYATYDQFKSGVDSWGARGLRIMLCGSSADEETAEKILDVYF